MGQVPRQFTGLPITGYRLFSPLARFRDLRFYAGCFRRIRIYLSKESMVAKCFLETACTAIHERRAVLKQQSVGIYGGGRPDNYARIDQAQLRKQADESVKGIDSRHSRLEFDGSLEMSFCGRPPPFEPAFHDTQ